MILFVAAWWIVSEDGIMTGWTLVVPIIASAALVSLLLHESGAWRFSVRGAARFLPFFAWQPILGGIDVARGAFQPNLRLEPDFIHLAPRLPPGPRGSSWPIRSARCRAR